LIVPAVHDHRVPPVTISKMHKQEMSLKKLALPICEQRRSGTLNSTRTEHRWPLRPPCSGKIVDRRAGEPATLCGGEVADLERAGLQVESEPSAMVGLDLPTPQLLGELAPADLLRPSGA
jgi:hypothetical protein